MALGGIIAGALSGGAQAVGQVADTQIQTNQRKDLATFESQLQMERQTALARLQQSIGREDTLYNTTGEGGKAKTAYEVDRTRQVGDVETEQLGKREGVIGAARGEAERKNLAAYATDGAARAGVRAKTSDQESNSAKTATAVAAFELEQKRAVMDLRKQAARLRAGGNEDAAAQTEAMIATLTGATQSKTYGDVVKAAEVYSKMASDQAAILADPVKSATLTDAQRDQMTQNIQRYQQAADQILSGATEKRGVSAKPPGGAAPEAKPGAMPPPKAVEYLRQNPSTKAAFDAKYGAGMADKFLQGK